MEAELPAGGRGRAVKRDVEHHGSRFFLVLMSVCCVIVAPGSSCCGAEYLVGPADYDFMFSSSRDVHHLLTEICQVLSRHHGSTFVFLTEIS